MQLELDGVGVVGFLGVGCRNSHRLLTRAAERIAEERVDDLAI
jgi:hypothetical protein